MTSLVPPSLCFPNLGPWRGGLRSLCVTPSQVVLVDYLPSMWREVPFPEPEPPNQLHPGSSRLPSSYLRWAWHLPSLPDVVKAPRFTQGSGPKPEVIWVPSTSTLASAPRTLCRAAGAAHVVSPRAASCLSPSLLSHLAVEGAGGSGSFLPPAWTTPHMLTLPLVCPFLQPPFCPPSPLSVAALCLPFLRPLTSLPVPFTAITWCSLAVPSCPGAVLFPGASPSCPAVLSAAVSLQRPLWL